MRRIIGEVQPRFVVVENSPMLVTRGLARVIADLAGMGFDTRWGVLRGDNAGVPQRRARLWIVANATRQSSQGIHDQNAVHASGDRAGLDAGGGHNADAHNEDSGTRPLPVLADSYWREVFDGGGSRGIDGLADRVAREKATGNGQVPAVVKLAWEVLSA
jgi:DNA (cytosine-5)-methyltransferase 1